MNAKDIKSQIVSTLEADSGLINFPVKKVFEGIRDNVPLTLYPNICIEPVDNSEGARRSVNGHVANLIGFAISGFIHDYDVDDQLDLIFDFENLIKKALSQDMTLGGYCVNSYFERSLYVNQFWPVRVVTIPFMVEYQQLYKTRT